MSSSSGPVSTTTSLISPGTSSCGSSCTGRKAVRNRDSAGLMSSLGCGPGWVGKGTRACRRPGLFRSGFIAPPPSAKVGAKQARFILSEQIPGRKEEGAEFVKGSSANLTEYAFTINMELGVLVTGGKLPGQVQTHFDRLMLTGTLATV